MLKKSRERFPKVFEVPFSSKRKMMTVACQYDNFVRVYSKGGCFEILERCQLSNEERGFLRQQNDEMAEKGLRVIASAYKDVGSDYSKSEIEKELIFLGLIGLEDPPREGVDQALKLCREADIKVFMVTGDYSLTATAIAKQVGLYSDQTKVVTGDELHQMDEERLKEVLKGEAIFARIEPNQKLRIVKTLQEMGETVAVTGDGVNDVPALVKANIGIAMGEIGTEVAKEAADIILLDDHFATIVTAIREGRRIFDNAKKFVFYVFSSNSGELFTPLIGIIIGLPLPLLPLQILAIDLGTDVFPSLALGVENEEGGIMKKPPRSKSERIMSFSMLGRLLSVGIFMAIASLIVFFTTLYSSGWNYGMPLFLGTMLYREATASVYLTLVLCQFANVLSCRSESKSIFKLGFLSNKWVIWAEVISFAMLGLMMFFPPIQEIFHTATPPFLSWIMAILFAALFFTTFELVKAHQVKGKVKLTPKLVAQQV